MNKQEVIKNLQYLVDGLSAGALNHEIHSRVFGAQGFSKLEQKYKEHANEERDFVVKFIDRIIDLGGVVEQNQSEALPVFQDFKEYLEHDLQVQKDGVAMLVDCVKLDKLDIASYELLKEYYLDEEEDLYWMEQQLELMERIGYQNYLLQQL